MKSRILAVALISLASVGVAYAQAGQAGGEPVDNFKSTASRAAVQEKAVAAEKAGSVSMKGGQEGGVPRTHFKSKKTRKQVKQETKDAIKKGEMAPNGQ